MHVIQDIHLIRSDLGAGCGGSNATGERTPLLCMTSAVVIAKKTLCYLGLEKIFDQTLISLRARAYNHLQLGLDLSLNLNNRPSIR